MAEDNSVVDGFLQEGSKVSVLCSAYPTVFRDKPHMGLNLVEVKVHEAVLYEGGNGGGGQADPWAALGLTSAVVPDFGDDKREEKQNDVTSSPEVPKPVEEDPEEFSDIPF